MIASRMSVPTTYFQRLEDDHVIHQLTFLKVTNHFMAILVKRNNLRRPVTSFVL